MTRTKACEFSADKHAAVIGPHVQLPSFISYGGMKSKLEVRHILAVRSLWQNLRVFHEPLTFAQKTLRSALLIVHKQKSHEWPRQIEGGMNAVEQWADVTALRIRAQARAI